MNSAGFSKYTYEIVHLQQQQHPAGCLKVARPLRPTSFALATYLCSYVTVTALNLLFIIRQIEKYCVSLVHNCS